MKIYHGTTLSVAEKLVNRKFSKRLFPNSLGFSINLANKVNEARTFAQIKKWDDKNEKGALVEFDIDLKKSKVKKVVFNEDNKYYYNIYKNEKPDLIEVLVGKYNNFKVYIIYNYDVVKDIKIKRII